EIGGLRPTAAQREGDVVAFDAGLLGDLLCGFPGDLEGVRCEIVERIECIYGHQTTLLARAAAAQTCAHLTYRAPRVHHPRQCLPLCPRPVTCRPPPAWRGPSPAPSSACRRPSSAPSLVAFGIEPLRARGAAVHVERLADDVTRFRGGEEDVRRGELCGLARPRERRRPAELGQGIRRLALGDLQHR